MFEFRCFLALLVASSTSEAFAPSSSWRPSSSMTPSALYLTTDDCQELVAASKVFYHGHHHHHHGVQDDAADDEEAEDWTTLVLPDSHAAAASAASTARRSNAVAFVRRLFAQPTAAFHPHAAEGLDEYAVAADVAAAADGGDDIVYFPVRFLF